MSDVQSAMLLVLLSLVPAMFIELLPVPTCRALNTSSTKKCCSTPSTWSTDASMGQRAVVGTLFSAARLAV